MTEPHHLSKLLLDRYLAGELSPEEAAKVEARLDDRAQQHLDAVREARGSLPAFDAAVLRERANALGDESPTALYDEATAHGDDPPVAAVAAPEPQPRAEAPPEPIDLDAQRRARGLTTVLSGVLLAAAALFAVFAFYTVDPETGEPPSYGVRAGQLTIHVAEGGELHPYSLESEVGAGDVLGFKVVAGPHDGVVLLSVDGTGMISLFFPQEGLDPEPLEGPGQVALPGTVMLDGAPGPEVFVAVFDRSADEAKAMVRDTYWARGHAGLRALDTLPDVAVAEVRRR